MSAKICRNVFPNLLIKEKSNSYFVYSYSGIRSIERDYPLLKATKTIFWFANFLVLFIAFCDTAVLKTGKVHLECLIIVFNYQHKIQLKTDVAGINFLSILSENALCSTSLFSRMLCFFTATSFTLVLVG